MVKISNLTIKKRISLQVDSYNIFQYWQLTAKNPLVYSIKHILLNILLNTFNYFSQINHLIK